MRNLTQLIPWALAIVYFLLCEILDNKSRMETLEKDYKWLWKLVNNRAMRLALIAICIGFLAKDYRDTTALMPVTIRVAAPAAPIINIVRSEPKIPSPKLSYIMGLSTFASTNGLVEIPELHFQNSGDAVATQVTLRLYFAERMFSMNPASWQPLDISDDPKMLTEFFAGGPAQISPGEIWHAPAFTGLFQPPASGSRTPIAGKMKMFYGGKTPAEASFTVMLRDQPAAP